MPKILAASKHFYEIILDMNKLFFASILLILWTSHTMASCLDDLLMLSHNNALFRDFSHINLEINGNTSSQDIILSGRLHGESVELGSIMFEDLGDALDIIYIHTHTNFRRLGIQTYLFQQLIARYPNARRWNIFSLSSVNRDLFTEHIKTTILNLNPYIFRQNTEATSARIIHGQIIDYITELDEDLQHDIITRAINATASMHSFNRLSFNLCPNTSPHFYLDDDSLINISFQVCR